jgi:phytoene dehydrogenase-like protein
MNDNNKIAIIGAGIAGMSAGIYAQMNGYQSIIFEKHNLPGGLCTSWKRKDYTFDGCVQWLTGSAPGTSLFGMWQELGAVQGRMMVNHDELFRIEGADGKNLILYTNMDRLERHLKELAPEDSRLISHFIRAVRAIANFIPPLPKAPELRNVWINSVRRFDVVVDALINGLFEISISDFAQKFKNPFCARHFR